MKKYFVVILAYLVTSFGCSEKTFVTIGTGAVTGVFYPTGGAICRMVNQQTETYGIKATVESTAGSVYNVNAVLNGDLEFGVVQSDRQYQAVHGLAEWADSGPRARLRSVFSIHPEAVTLIASVHSGIESVQGLRGKRVNIGNPGSGPLQNSRDVLEALGIKEGDFHAEYVKALEAPGLLQDERIDAFFYTVGHPNGNIKEATSGRIRVRIVPIMGEGIDRLIQKKPYYSKAVIPHDLYPQAVNDSNIETIGVRATLVTSASVDASVVYAITKEVFDGFEAFKMLHPAYASLTRENMVDGLTAPLHEGALRYYREIGLIDEIDERLILEDESSDE